MDHHFSWYSLLPFYDNLHEYLQQNYAFTVMFSSRGIFPDIKTIATVDHIYAALFINVILCSIGLSVYLKTKDIKNFTIPSKKVSLVNILEIYYEIVRTVIKDILGDKYKLHISFIGSLGLFIFFANVVGLFPGLPPCTGNLNTTLACGLSVFIYFNYYGFKVNGLGHIGHLANPLRFWWGRFLAPLFLPIEGIGLFVRPFSLGIRLAGNMIGDHSVMTAFASLCPLLLPLPFFFFGLVVSIIQAFVFCLLTSIYISLHTSEAH